MCLLQQTECKACSDAIVLKEEGNFLKFEVAFPSAPPNNLILIKLILILLYLAASKC